MKVKVIYFLIVSIIMVFAASCGNTSSTESTESVSADASDTEDTASADEMEGSGFSYLDANILSIEPMEMDMEIEDEWDSTIGAVYKVINNGTEPVDYVDIYFSYQDDDGNELDTDGRFNDWQIEPGCWVLIESSCWIDDGDEIPSVIEVICYDYTIGELYVEIDLQEESGSYGDAYVGTTYDFDSYNILTFAYDNEGIDELGYYNIDVQVTNNADFEIENSDASLALCDADGNCWQKDTRTSYSLLKPGKYVTLEMCDEADYEVEQYEIYQYSYTLSEEDENGCNNYVVNLQTEMVTGYYSYSGFDDLE